MNEQLPGQYGSYRTSPVAIIFSYVQCDSAGSIE